MIQFGEPCPACQLSTTGFCPEHALPVRVTYPTTTITYPAVTWPVPLALVPQGWQCPCCRRVYAPHVSTCSPCSEPVSVTVTYSTA